jgi:cell division septation protein DedD
MATKENNNTEESTERKNSKPPKKRGWPFWLVFFISAWMFFLGVMVGRGTSPVTFDINELEKKIAELKKSALQSEELRVQEASPVSPDVKSELEFYEALKMAEQTDPMDFIEQKPNAAVKPESPAKPENTANPEPAVKTKSVAKPEKMQEIKKNEVKAIPPVSETRKTNEKNDKHYSIQVASLKDSKEADRLVEIFRKRGYPAYRASAEVRNTGIWHRVRIGPFIKQSEALRILGPVSRESKGALIIEHSP